jgi:hypothetical protein
LLDLLAELADNVDVIIVFKLYFVIYEDHGFSFVQSMLVEIKALADLVALCMVVRAGEKC